MGLGQCDLSPLQPGAGRQLYTQGNRSQRGASRVCRVLSLGKGNEDGALFFPGSFPGFAQQGHLLPIYLVPCLYCNANSYLSPARHQRCIRAPGKQRKIPGLPSGLGLKSDKWENKARPQQVRALAESLAAGLPYLLAVRLFHAPFHLKPLILLERCLFVCFYFLGGGCGLSVVREWRQDVWKG